MSTKKVIGGSVAAIVILIIAQLAAQLAASALNLIKIPDGICNIIAGIFYVGLTYVILKIYIEKVIRLPISDFGMPVFHIKRKWILIAILLPLLVKGSYLFVLSGCVCFLAYEWKAGISYIKCRNYVYRNRGWICRRNGISGRYFKSFKEKMES